MVADEAPEATLVDETAEVTALALLPVAPAAPEPAPAPEACPFVAEDTAAPVPVPAPEAAD